VKQPVQKPPEIHAGMSLAEQLAANSQRLKKKEPQAAKPFPQAQPAAPQMQQPV